MEQKIMSNPSRAGEYLFHAVIHNYVLLKTSPSRAWLRLNALQVLACLLASLLALLSALFELSLCALSVCSLCELSL